METDLGKVFIGGISWDTDEDRLRDYFGKFGEVIEAIIMKDRSTGRSRGFGFVVFADPAVADEVVLEKHVVDGRTVEAKKAVPREDRSGVGRENGGGSVVGSPGTGRTKKIFVGGLPSSLTDGEFKGYFEQFGAITDVVVMYDHNTQRPRGFGFITFESEESVDKVLVRTFHELNGKMVEVKRAVPKEQSPGVNNLRKPMVGYSYSPSRPNSVLNGYNHGYGPSLVGGYGMRIDDRLGLLGGGRTGLSSFVSGLGMGINLDPGLSPSFRGNSNMSSSVAYGRALNPYLSVSPSRYNGIANSSSLLSSVARNIWGNGSNGSLNYGTNLLGSDMYLNSGIGNFDNSSINWSNSSVGGSSVGYSSGNLGDRDGEDNFGLNGANFGRTSVSGAVNFTRNSVNGGSQGSYVNLYNGNSVYGDPAWRSSSPELDNAGLFDYGFGNESTDVAGTGTAGFMGGYNITSNESNRADR